VKAVFISDIHLRSEKDSRYERMLAFLEQLQGDVDDLFIAGDFFDFWFCRDGDIYPPFQEVVGKLLELRNRGIRLHLFEGNHDFSLGPCLFEKDHVDVFQEWAEFTLDGERMLISHGDTVDTSNVRYMVLRKILRSRAFGRVESLLPARLLWKIAALSSSISKGLTIESRTVLAEKMKAFARQKFEEGFDAVILGHCHLPLLEQYEIGGRRKTFAVLGDWIDHYSYLLFEKGIYRLAYYRR
jgi:UDP-2,3-diacylglucosamine hydrolase